MINGTEWLGEERRSQSNSASKLVFWVLGILMTICGTISVYAVGKIDTVQTSLRLEYVQKADYRLELAEIKEGLKCINEKMDRVLQRR